MYFKLITEFYFEAIFFLNIYPAEIIILIETNELKATLLMYVTPHCGKPSTKTQIQQKTQLLRGDHWVAQTVLLIALYLLC